ncbi:PAS domain S-box protein [Halobaculum sp. EA56]|uniref:PAS domain S-box protein n=1 Tax=Halobaculum sp. EA56 TaxID=3421648 RepID=UPI003EC00F55
MTEPIRVLHVDDDPDFAELTATFLERTDDRFAVGTAHDAEAALARLDDGVDCVVSDYDMPGTNGIELLEAVRERRPDLPFVLFTGKGSEEVASDAITAGVTDYLQKKGGSDQYDLLANRIRNAVERARAEERATLWTRAVETANEGISVIDEDGRYAEMNEAYADCYGAEPEELIGEPWTTTVPDEEAERLNEEVFPDLAGEETWVGDSVGRRADGSTYPKVLSLAPLETGGHVCVVRDVSEDRERERDRNRKREDRRSAATSGVPFEHSPDMIAVHDVDGRILDANRRLCDALGYGTEELVGTDIAAVDERIEPAGARDRRRRMEPGETRDREGRYRRADGSTFPVEVHLVKADTADGARFFVFGRDVSDDREREYERTILERGVAQIEAGVGAYDADGTLVFFNDYYAHLLGTTPADLRGRKVWEANPLLEAERFDDYWTSYGRGETRVHETLHRRFDTGEEVPVRTTTTRVRVDGDDYHVGTIADISEQKARERRLEREVERLDEFASVVSHDLRNPLNVADGRLRLVREEHDSAHLDDIERALDRMEALIDDLLAFAREGEEVHDPEPVDLRATVEASWGNVDTAEATLTVDTDRTVRADEGRLRQLFENLVRNAVEHAGGDVAVDVGDLPGGFYVEDDGDGIDPEVREEVFDTGVTTAEEGTGFGLSIARQIADAHGWSIRATEGASGGARFEVTGVTVVE